MTFVYKMELMILSAWLEMRDWAVWLAEELAVSLQPQVSDGR